MNINIYIVTKEKLSEDAEFSVALVRLIDLMDERVIEKICLEKVPQTK